MAETEYQRTPRAYEEMMSLINALDTPLEGNVFRDISGQLWNLWKKTMIDSGYTDIQVEMAKGRFIDLATRLDAGDAYVDDLKIKINDDLSDDNILRLIHSVVSAGDEIFTPVGLEQFMTAQNGAWAI